MVFRRTFLAGIGGLLVAGAAGAAKAATPRKEIDLGASYVTNLGEHLLGESLDVAEGASVEFQREPGRRYDANSIAVIGPSGNKLGYLPADQSRMLAPLMDGGLRAHGTVTASIMAPRPSLRLRLSVAPA